MTDPTCPSCNLPVSQTAFATGTCPCCDYHFEHQPGELPLTEVVASIQPQPESTPPVAPRRRPASLLAAAASFAIGVFAGYLLFARDGNTPSLPETAKSPASTEASANSEITAIPIAKQKVKSINPDALPVIVPTPPKTELAPPPTPVAVASPPEPQEKPIIIDPLENPDRKLDAPAGTAEVIALDGSDRLTLTGRVKVLKLNSINGDAQVDASGLEAEEIILDGDVNGNCRVRLNSRNGKVTIRGAFVGSSTLAVTAPGGTVTVAEGGRIGGGTTVTLTAKKVEAIGAINEGAKVNVTLTSGGAIRIATMDGGAIVTYRRSGAGDPQPKVETGQLRGGTRVVEAK